jgi:hypothetical protein
MEPFSYPTAISCPSDENANDRIADGSDIGINGVLKDVTNDIRTAFQNLFRRFEWEFFRATKMMIFHLNNPSRFGYSFV